MQEIITVEKLVTEFELTLSEVPNIAPTTDIEGLSARIKEFKTIMKRQYRKLVKQYHPDVSTDKKAAHEKLIRLNRLMKCVDSLKLQIKNPPMQMHFEYRVYRSYTGTSDTGTSSTTGGWGGSWS